MSDEYRRVTPMLNNPITTSENIHKEFLLLESDLGNAESFFNFSKQCNVKDKILHLSAVEDATNFILFNETYDIKIIILSFKAYAIDQIDFMWTIRNTPRFKSLPLVLLAESWGDKEIMATRNIIISALILYPLTLVKFKRIIALAGYTCGNSV